MRRFAMFILAVGMLLAGLLAVGPVSVGQAQQGTPAASGSTGVTTEVLGRFPSELAPGSGVGAAAHHFRPWRQCGPAHAPG